VEDDPKSERGKRTLPLTKALSRAFRDHRKRQAVERLAVGAAYEDSGYVVVDEIGRPLHPDTLTDRFDRLVAGAGVRRIRLHDARHTCGTLMHLGGEPVAVISAWLGHSSPAFTMRTYVHSQDDALRGAAARLDSVFDQSL
jgi:integrase